MVGGGDGTVTSFDGTTLHDTAQESLNGQVVSLSFSPDCVEVSGGVRGRWRDRDESALKRPS